MRTEREVREKIEELMDRGRRITQEIGPEAAESVYAQIDALLWVIKSREGYAI